MQRDEVNFSDKFDARFGRVPQSDDAEFLGTNATNANVPNDESVLARLLIDRLSLLLRNGRVSQSVKEALRNLLVNELDVKTPTPPPPPVVSNYASKDRVPPRLETLKRQNQASTSRDLPPNGLSLSRTPPTISAPLSSMLRREESKNYLTDGAVNPTLETSTPNFDALTLAYAEQDAAPEKFLGRLRVAESVEKTSSASAEELKFLQKRSALEQATDDAPMWLVSLLAHAFLVLILAFIAIKTDANQLLEIISEPGFGEQTVLDEAFDPEAKIDDKQEFEFDAANIDVQSEIVADVPDVSVFHDDDSAKLALAESTLGFEPASSSETTNWLGTLNGDDLAGRGEAKAVALATGGGTEGSEKAVALALAWLAEHQAPNGAWTFQLDKVPTCGGRCANAGSNASINAATAMGLLPFLAAGHTPTTGKYKKVVAKGLNYLTQAGVKTENGRGYNDSGNMYAHGLATIALCETYAMLNPKEKSRYRELGYIAQDALDYIAYAQADDGGWRYQPKQAGDTSVVGWQMMALKSGQLGGLYVSDAVVRNARDFLQDVVGFDYGSRYNYTEKSGSSNATDSIGLLCRLYLDWRVDNPQLLKGAARLSEIGPQLNNPYYNYYASQLMHHIGGELWRKWNETTREALIKSQRMEGHERGSWFPENADAHCVEGGRLYATSLNCMILEVYYRHMPLYRKLEGDSQFPIDVPDQP